MAENIKCPMCASLDIALYYGQPTNSRIMICCRCFYMFETGNIENRQISLN